MAKKTQIIPVLLLILACLGSVGCGLFQAIPKALMHPLSSGETQYEICQPNAIGVEWIHFEIGQEGASCNETATARVHVLTSSDKLKVKVIGLRVGTMVTMDISSEGVVSRLTVMKKAPTKGLEFE